MKFTLKNYKVFVNNKPMGAVVARNKVNALKQARRIWGSKRKVKVERKN